MSEELKARWQKQADGKFAPTPPYTVGEVVDCENGCGRKVKIGEREAREQWAGQCRACDRLEDAYVEGMASA